MNYHKKGQEDPHNRSTIVLSIDNNFAYKVMGFEIVLESLKITFNI
jgi:hypothetical protein